MIQDNVVAILGWIQLEKIKWLQNNNPEVPGLVYKMAPMDEKMRKLNNVRKLWEAVLDIKPVVDVFKNEVKIHNKLVRDRIPKIIETAGKLCVTHILTDEEYIAELETKLNEEVAEYQADKNLEEMADVLEVLQAICIVRGYSLEELETTRSKKAKEHGGFRDKIFLEYVE